MTTVGATFIRGELDHPWAGAGGGGGGNAINSNTFPERPFDPTADEIGAGGGGGGGGVTLFALGAIEFGPAGRIDASGGTGGGGENSLQTGAVTHIGGGSGGGSGGHVVLQSSERIDLSRCSSSSHPPGGIYALGGEGGAGKNNLGGAIPGGLAVGAAADALPPDSYPAATSPCGVVQGRAGYTFTNDFPDHSVVICAGGDGGPGIVQLHTPSPSDVIPPQGPGENIYTIVQPPPVSSLPATGVPSYRTINDPARWASMFPAWGMRSRATSTWSPIHADPRGLGLPPQRASARVSVADVRELVVDGGAIEDFYLRYPSLLDGADLRISDLPDQRVVSATWDEDTSELRLELDPYGAPLRGFGQEGSIEILPRLRPVFVDAVAAKLPHDLRVRVEVQLAPSAADGSPDVSRSSVWTDAFGIASAASGFARYRGTVVPGEPAEDVEGSPHVAPAADFLRVPLGF